jgi:hypothetical protein
MSNPVATVIVLTLVLAPVRAQTVEGLPTEHSMLIPPGAWVDLDSGAILPRRELLQAKADFRFDRDGTGFYVAPLHGGAAGGEQAIEPEAWSPARLRLALWEGKPHVWFVRTDRGAVARIRVAAVDSYSTGSAVLAYVLAPSAMAVFVPAPTALEATWRGKNLEVTWQGDAPGYLVEIDSGGAVQKTTTKVAQASFAGLVPDGVHRVRVRGLMGDGVITLPAEVVQHGARRAPVRGEVRYPDNWYRREGGLSLLRGESAGEDAEVAFYLYGVYVPGGGVQKIGEGAACYRDLATLPEAGYLPVYGRLDDHDVLAVRLADGRYAKLLLEPAKDGDVRSGMVVHFAFLADGRRALLPAPGAVAFARRGEGLRLTWAAVPGALRYRVHGALLAKPIETAEPEVLLGGVPENRMCPVEIVAIGADGEVSDARLADVHSYDDDHRVGTFELDYQRDGFGFGRAAKVALRADGTAPPELDLLFTGGAGNWNSMNFSAPWGARGAGDLAFGEFPATAAALQALQFDERYTSDDRTPGFERFLVRTGDGGLASVRIRVRDSRAVFDYVLRLPQRGPR